MIVHHRSMIHITANGWLNDPCAPGYDASTGLFHLFYQWNPDGCLWGNISWGHVTSKDMVFWSKPSSSPVLKPDMPYDKDGVFTGCLLPPAQTKPQMSTLTVFYTNVCHLPIHYSEPYPRGAAGLAAASSEDGGLTWKKVAQNPILKEEPSHLIVTGFRDPFIGRWKALDELRHVSSPVLYGSISGGIAGSGPTAFMYAINPQNPLEWEYIGSLVRLPPKWRPSKKWNGSYGVNWECTNFMTLRSETSGGEMHLLITGAEGDRERRHHEREKPPPGLSHRMLNWVVWLSGSLKKWDNGNISLEYGNGGIFDHGTFYAPNSFYDSKHNRQVMHGWITEEDIPESRFEEKGWSGSLALPRELYLQEIPRVIGALRSSVDELTCFESRQEEDGTLTLYTLGIRPLAELDSLRRNALNVMQMGEVKLAGASVAGSALLPTAPLSCMTWELTATFSVPASCRRVGFHFHVGTVLDSLELSAQVSVFFSAVDESITLDRSQANSDPSVRKVMEKGPHTLFRTRRSVEGPGPVREAVIDDLEKLALRVIWDGDVVEIFANDRFAMATTVYMDTDLGAGRGLTIFAEGDEEVILHSMTVWDGLNGGRTAVAE